MVSAPRPSFACLKQLLLYQPPIRTGADQAMPDHLAVTWLRMRALEVRSVSDFNSFEMVTQWVNEKGIDELRRALDVGRFSGQNLRMAAAWLQEHDRKDFERERQLSLDATKRATEATERATVATEKAARWTFWASVAAAASACASVVQAWLSRGVH